jgi:hypothetical protein
MTYRTALKKEESIAMGAVDYRFWFGHGLLRR